MNRITKLALISVVSFMTAACSNNPCDSDYSGPVPATPPAGGCKCSTLNHCLSCCRVTNPNGPNGKPTSGRRTCDRSCYAAHQAPTPQATPYSGLESSTSSLSYRSRSSLASSPAPSNIMPLVPPAISAHFSPSQLSEAEAFYDTLTEDEKQRAVASLESITPAQWSNLDGAIRIALQEVDAQIFYLAEQYKSDPNSDAFRFSVYYSLMTRWLEDSELRASILGRVQPTPTPSAIE
ncbi:MAG: hypothetical protein J5J00_08900 [Deltaproteobacteria bacterium]|nr:hypothetical protein [Deltaproteobacteria bacterium]